MLPQRHFQTASRLQRAIPLPDALPLEAAARTVRRPHSALRQLLLEYFQADGIACRQITFGLKNDCEPFYLPDGQTSDGRETYTLVANPNNKDVQVMISYLLSDGTGAGYFIATVPANSRATFNMGDKIPSGRASIAVTCHTTGLKVLVERSMYWNNRGVGTNTVGDWSH